jgi:hypothetical protein
MSMSAAPRIAAFAPTQKDRVIASQPMVDDVLDIRRGAGQ